MAAADEIYKTPEFRKAFIDWMRKANAGKDVDALQKSYEDAFAQYDKDGGRNIFGKTIFDSADVQAFRVQYDGGEQQQEQQAKLAAPDLTDERLRQSRAAQMLKLLSGRGRKSTFLTGPLGDTMKPAPAGNKPTLARNTLLGGY